MSGKGVLPDIHSLLHYQVFKFHMYSDLVYICRVVCNLRVTSALGLLWIVIQS